MKTSRWPRPQHVLLAVAAYLVVAYGLFVLVDVLHIVDFAWPASHVHPLFYELFAEHRVTEWLQFITMAFAAVTAAHISGLLRERGMDGPRGFWTVTGVAFAFLVVEDAASIRHMLVRYGSFYVEQIQPMATIVEVSYYALLASVPLYAVVRYARHIWHHAATRRFLLAGYALYGFAAFTSATSGFGDWYVRLGDWVALQVLRGRIMEMPSGMHGVQAESTTGYMLLDVLFEETVELMAAALLLAGALTYLAYITGRPQGSGVRRDDPPVTAAHAEPRAEEA